jgi:hypothetical protein
MSDEGRRRGRPPIGSEVKRASFNTRLRESLKRRLEDAADQNGRSLSEEIERRLEASLDREHTLDEAIATAFGGPRTAALLKTMGTLAYMRCAAEDEWLSDYHAFLDITRVSWPSYFDRLAPPKPDPVAETVEIGRMFVTGLAEGRLTKNARQLLCSNLEDFAADPDLPEAVRAEFLKAVEKARSAS